MELPEIKPVDVNVVEEADVAAAIKGLEPGATYLSSDIYRRYEAVARARGREPGHPVAVGQVLSRFGASRRKKRPRGGKLSVAWYLSHLVVRMAEHTDKEPGKDTLSEMPS